MTIYTTAAQVGADITARMATVIAANGYTSEIGTRVFRGKVSVDDDLVPCVSIIEGNDDVQNGPSQRFATAHIHQQYAMVAYVPCDPDNPNDAAHVAIAEMKRAIFGTDGKADPTWGGKVRAVRYRGRNIGPRADGVALVMAIVEIEVEYAENLAGV